MDYTIKGVEGARSASIVSSLGGGRYVVSIGGREHEVEIVSADSRGIEFMLGSTHHRAVYLPGEPLVTRMLLDGTEMSVRRDTGLDEVVYKNSGGPAGAADSAVTSKVPGKIVSVKVSEGDEVQADAPVCVIESMKMQIEVRAHKAGKVSSVPAKEGANVAKGDTLAEIE